MTVASGGFATYNPTTGELLERFDYHTAAEIDRRLEQATSGLSRWRGSTVETRVDAIRRLAALLTRRRETFAAQIVREMGKPLGQALAEIDKCVTACDYYADRLPEMLAPHRVDVTPDVANVHLRPLGVVFAILPWNYPWWQVIRAMLPAIAVGNTVVLKHAESVSGCARTIESALREVFDDDVLTVVYASGEQSSAVIRDPRIAAVTFTGSERIGALVAQTAGSVVKKCVLELGGSDPFIVLEDADLLAAGAAAVRSRFINNGQSCIAAKRIVVHREVRDDLVDAMSASLADLRVGDPLDSRTDIGPIARDDLAAALRDQVDRARAHGDTILFEGSAPDSGGWWFAPTVLEVGRSGSPLVAEETFGPLAALTVVDSEEEALRVANDSPYGLSSSVWTADAERGERVAARLEVGSVFVNTISVSDPRLPVGGVKASGYGRELGEYGIREFANIQAVRRSL